MKITDLTALELGRRIRGRELSVREALEAVLKQIHENETRIHAYITLADETALFARADRIQKAIDEGSLTGPLAGVPAAVKDNICTEGMATTCGSRILSGFVPPYQATAAARLEKAGVLLLGKTNMDEFAMGSTTETSWFGPTKNPWDESRVPRGSSGGSCAAVAAGEAFFALGSDTGGSIRQPASFCGVTGIKPTYGTVSRYGLIAYGSSLDQIGPVARDTADCAAVLDVIAGYDPKDSTSVRRSDPGSFTSCAASAAGLRIGIPDDYLGKGLDPEVKDAVLAAAESLQEQGAQVRFFSLGLVRYAIPAYYVIACAEASSNLARFDGVKYGFRAERYEGLHGMYKESRSQGFGSEVKRRILLGSFVLSSGYYDAYYLKALRVKAQIRKAFDEAFRSFDLVLGPAAPAAAPRLGESLSDPLRMYLGDIYTVAANLAGLPGLCLPCGKTKEGLPIGVQLMADRFQEAKLFGAARAYEQVRGTFPMPGGKKEKEAAR